MFLFISKYVSPLHEERAMFGDAVAGPLTISAETTLNLLFYHRRL